MKKKITTKSKYNSYKITVCFNMSFVKVKIQIIKNVLQKVCYVPCSLYIHQNSNEIEATTQNVNISLHFR